MPGTARSIGHGRRQSSVHLVTLPQRGSLVDGRGDYRGTEADPPVVVVDQARRHGRSQIVETDRDAFAQLSSRGQNLVQ